MAAIENSDPLKKTPVAIAILVSGLCWYFSNGLHGDVWYVLWIAPVPILLISTKTTAGRMFFISFAAYLIGRLSWFSYLVTVATLIPAIIFTIALPLVFALIMTGTRRVIMKSTSWYAVFAFPVFFTAFEWLVVRFSPDGSAASMAYSQLDCIPLIQIASVTGILGITFVVTFIPSSLAQLWHFRKEKARLIPLACVSLAITLTVFLFGSLRITNDTGETTLIAGLVTLEEKSHKMDHLDFQNELLHTRNYIREVEKLAARGAEIVVLPERAINIGAQTDVASIGILSQSALQSHVTIVIGYTNYKTTDARNSTLVIDDTGEVLVDYDKAHLVTGLENQFTPGTKIGLFSTNGRTAGTAICKDLDFPQYIRQYGWHGISVLCVPAWDFIVDDWLHSRMAILRGVENGFSQVRTARLGRLTITDPYGRVTAEAISADGKTTTLTGNVSLAKLNTVYVQYGDWFGWCIVIAAVFFIWWQALVCTRNLKN